MTERIGVVGGGQLGLMLTEAAHPLGFQVTVLDATPNCPATGAGARQIEGSIQDPDAIRELAAGVDVVTLEIEHVNTAALIELMDEGYNIQPDPLSVRTIQDKYRQKVLLRDAGLPVPDFAALGERNTLSGSIESHLGSAVMIKTRKGGYDGRGNFEFNGSYADVEAALGKDWTSLYVERKIDFEKELSVVAARDTSGQVSLFPTVETVHKDNICHTVVCPADISPRAQREVDYVARETLEHLGGAGVFAIEMFWDGSQPYINEIAPRVHNSGHHTIEATVTSQFEQHIRAITGMPLGATDMRVPAAAMINILGKEEGPLNRGGLDKVLARPDVHPHFYGKSPRAKRKIGHITVLGKSTKEVLRIAKEAREELAI